MKLSPTLCLTSLLLLPLCTSAHGQDATATTAAVEYVPLEQLRGFYKLMPQAGTATGVRTVGNAGTTITFGPGKKDVSIGGYRWQLSYPIKEDGAGDLLISKVDMVKLIDPVLRPTYIAERRLIRTVILDPGHGGYDGGCGTDRLREANFTLQLALELRELLRKRGYNVLMTHEQNRHVSDHRRIECTAGADAPIFLSLHLNSGRSDQKGIQTYTAAPAEPGAPLLPGNKHDAANAALAFAIHSALVAKTGATDGGCRRARYTLLNSIDCPSAMVLPGYATHAEEVAQLSDPAYRTRIAEAIADGVGTFARSINPGTTLEPTPEAAPPPPEPVKATPPPPPPSKKKTKSAGSKKNNTRKNNRRRRR